MRQNYPSRAFQILPTQLCVGLTAVHSLDLVKVLLSLSGGPNAAHQTTEISSQEDTSKKSVPVFIV